MVLRRFYATHIGWMSALYYSKWEKLIKDNIRTYRDGEASEGFKVQVTTQ